MALPRHHRLLLALACLLLLLARTTANPATSAATATVEQLGEIYKRVRASDRGRCCCGCVMFVRRVARHLRASAAAAAARAARCRAMLHLEPLISPPL